MEPWSQMMHDLGHEYSDDCEDCQPILMDLTGKILDKNHPIMLAILKVWKEDLTFDERRITSDSWKGKPIKSGDIEVINRVAFKLREVTQGLEE